MSAAGTLSAGLQGLGLPLSAVVQDKLLAYARLVEKWNRVYNLTAVREAERIVSLHLLDSLAVARYLEGDSLLDVGSGAGLPGIPLALARPELAVTLLEANHKKAAFLKQAAIEIGLPNVDVVNARVEDWKAPRLYDVVISRAFSDLADFVTLAGRHVAEGGALAAMKGVYPFEELAQLPAPYELGAAIALNVPGLDAERHLILVRRGIDP
jgi:16S rRNA (guanine527-N7)-methyltransferase